MSIAFYYYLSSIILVVLFLISIVSIKVYNHMKRVSCIKNFPDYVVVLEYHLVRAYELVHKDEILIYSLEASRVREEDIDKVSEHFVRLVIKLIGPTLYKEFINLYGDDSTFIFNIIEYFNTRYEDDAIRNDAINEITSKEEDEVP
jgi:hypothetical protein